METNQSKLPLNITSFLVVALIIASFAIGSLWTKVQYLEKGAVAGAKNTADAGTKPAQPTQPEGFGSADNVEKLKDDDHLRGDKKARFLLIEYSDFQCPYCQRFHPTAKQALDEFKGELAWIYRHFPLESIHPLARNAGEASACAAEQGGSDAFWKYADKLFEVTPAIGEAELPKLADSVGLDGSKIKSCLDSGGGKERVDRDLKSGTSAGIQGTPGNILLDTKTGKTKVLSGAVPLETIKQALEELKKEG